MPTLRELWRSVFPQAQPFPGPGPALDRPVAWVRVLKSRVPAFDALETEDLAIVQHQTLESLRALGVEPGSVIEAIATAGGSGVLLVGQPNRGTPETQEMLQRSAARGLAAFQLGETDVGGLERSAIAYIVAGEAELERRVAELEGQLEQAALAGAGMEGLVAIIARFLARPAAIEGTDGKVLAVHAPPDAAGDALGVGQYLQGRRGEALRLPLPLSPGQRQSTRARSAAALVLLGAASPSELELLAARRVTGLLALELGRSPPLPAAAPRSRERLPADGPDWLVIVARQIDDSRPMTLEQRERLRHELLRSEPAGRLMLRGDASSLELRLVAAPGAADPRGLALARRLARLLDRPVALSRPFSAASERQLAEAQARVTLEALEALPLSERAILGDGDGVVIGRAELAPAYRLAAGVQALPDGMRHARSLLAPLLSGRPQRDGRLLATLRAVLDHSGLSEAAAALGIHRNTLAYRLDAIERQTGWRLSDSGVRFGLALAVRLVQNEQELEAKLR